MARVITVTPNPLLDFVTDHRLVTGTVNRCTGFAVAAEGKGVNVAKVLARHGHDVQVHGFAGGPSGAWFADLLAGRGLTLALTPTIARLRCGMLTVTADTPPTALLEHGFPVTTAECARLLATIEAALPNCDLLISSGSVPDPHGDGLLAAIAERCAMSGVPCWLDAYGEAMRRALTGPAPVALVKPNREEYTSLTDWGAAGEVHRTDGPGRVLVRDAVGAVVAVEPPAVDVINPVGSGDCYLAGLAHARLAGWSWEDQLCYAVAAGAVNAAELAVAEIDPARITALASGVQVRKVEGHDQ